MVRPPCASPPSAGPQGGLGPAVASWPVGLPGEGAGGARGPQRREVTCFGERGPAPDTVLKGIARSFVLYPKSGGKAAHSEMVLCF